MKNDNPPMEKLDDALEKLFQRPGLNGNKKTQGVIRDIAHGYMEMLLEQQKHTNSKAPFRHVRQDDESANELLRDEQLKRIDLHLVDWSNESLKKLAQEPETLQAYKEEYLLPTLAKYQTNFSGNLSEEELLDYMLGSIIKVVTDTLGGARACDVPDSYNTASFASALLSAQRRINAEMLKR